MEERKDGDLSIIRQMLEGRGYIILFLVVSTALLAYVSFWKHEGVSSFACVIGVALLVVVAFFLMRKKPRYTKWIIISSVIILGIAFAVINFVADYQETKIEKYRNALKTLHLSDSEGDAW